MMDSALRRRLLLGGLAALLAGPAQALMPVAPGRAAPSGPRLDADQSRAFRAWVVLIAEEQIRRGPTPRWSHRDCAGLVRFAVAEALAEHDARWRKSMGLDGRLPPETVPDPLRNELRHQWRRPDGSSGAYVNAIGLVQENSRAMGRDLRLARPADLLFFDQGDAQHLMLWTGRRIVYHNGAEPRPGDDGLRAVAPQELLAWNDTRWRPDAANPNFAGIFTLAFLT
nr:DUF1175 family protein [Azoarcus sp. TTM-91]